MKLANCLTAAAAATAAFLGTMTFSLAENGTVTGKVGTKANANITIEAGDPTDKKAKTVYHRLNFDVNTRVNLGDGEIKPAELDRGWMVNVEWSQQADPDLDKRKEALIKAKASQSKLDALKNRNPQLATKITVLLVNKPMIYKGTDSNGGISLEFTQEAEGKKKAVKVNAVGKTLNRAKIVKDGADEIRLSDIKVGTHLSVEFVDRPGQERFPLIYRIDAKSEVK